MYTFKMKKKKLHNKVAKNRRKKDFSRFPPLVGGAGGGGGPMTIKGVLIIFIASNLPPRIFIESSRTPMEAL